ncbi:MAG: YebC/PmpR family DNA-binding transcriptional regulator [Chitinophagales bacterium]|nr:YebC/PmpR family DNA-binding transcriptional regulator [Chitinophagales bacterium]
MGRAFEYRKARKFARWDAMAKAFTKIGKEISISVKQGGADIDNNPRLRAAVQNAKAVNMPKDRVEAAIKRASSKEEKDYQEIVYEGYGPFGVGIVIECATDNPTRTVANVRHYFTKAGGSLGTSGSLDFIFTRKGVFRINPEGIDMDELELELIDLGADEIEVTEEGIIVYTRFEDYGAMQKGLEEKNIPVVNSELQRIPNTHKDLTDDQEESLLKLIDNLENDDDVQAVYHNAN